MPTRSNDGPTATPLPLGTVRCPSGLRLFLSAQRENVPGVLSTIETNTPEDDDMTSSDANSKARRALTRRRFLKTTAGTAALLGALKTQFPFGAHVAQAAGPEVKKAILGYIALMDASPLVIAKEKGLFAKHGMPDVEVSKQASWGATRDNMVLGGAANGIDGAHILTPMPYLISAGKVTQNNVPTPMYILARLNLDAQAISVSNEYKDLKIAADASPLKAAFAKKIADGKK